MIEDVRKRVSQWIYILNKVCRKYAEGMQCITLTLSTYLVLHISLKLS